MKANGMKHEYHARGLVVRHAMATGDVATVAANQNGGQGQTDMGLGNEQDKRISNKIQMGSAMEDKLPVP